jgi:hypothetical protein
MKELRVLLLGYLLIITVLLVFSCNKVATPPPFVVDLGKQAQSTAITKVTPVLSNGNVTVTMRVTRGAKYSLQVTDLLENELKTFGFTADDTIYMRKLDLTSLKNGDYNLILIDIAGKESKQNLIIKK